MLDSPDRLTDALPDEVLKVAARNGGDDAVLEAVEHSHHPGAVINSFAQFPPGITKLDSPNSRVCTTACSLA